MFEKNKLPFLSVLFTSVHRKILFVILAYQNKRCLKKLGNSLKLFVLLLHNAVCRILRQIFCFVCEYRSSATLPFSIIMPPLTIFNALKRLVFTSLSSHLLYTHSVYCSHFQKSLFYENFSNKNCLKINVRFSICV